MADERKLIIVGTGSQARYVIENLGRNGRARIAGLVDLERRENVGEVINGVEVLCPIDELDVDPTSHDAIVAYGDNRRKRDVVARLADMGFGFASAISSHAYVSGSVEIGPGCIVNPHAVIMPNARLGSHVIVHSHGTIEHDDVLEDYANVAPGVSLGGT